jgi:precorrin-4/cobalt-precorrin-4 C11-methyltransferase
VAALCEAGVDADTAVAVAEKPGRPDEVLIRTTLAGLVAEVKRHNLWRPTLFLVGDAVREGKPRVSTEDAPSRWASRPWRAHLDPESRRPWTRRGESDAGTPQAEETPESDGVALVEEPVSETPERTPVDEAPDAAESRVEGPEPAGDAPARPVRKPAAKAKRPARSTGRRTAKKSG